MLREHSSRREELRQLCSNISLNLNLSHFTVNIGISLYKSEIKWLKRKYPQLIVDEAGVLNSGLIYCYISKR